MKNRMQITPYIQKLTDISCKNNNIVPDMYISNNVKRGLRDENGHGVITGLTEISDIVSRKRLNVFPCRIPGSKRNLHIKSARKSIYV